MSLAVHVSAVFFDHVVEDTFARMGSPVVLGGTDRMALPVPQGMPYLARVTWRTARTVAVEQPDGHMDLLERGGVVSIERGPLRLEIRLIERYPLRRIPSMAALMTSAGGVVLLFIPLLGVLGLVPGQIGATNQAWCSTWVGEVLPPESIPIVADLMSPCTQNTTQGSGPSSDRVAEYLERVLRKDFDGEDEGHWARAPTDRQFGEREVDDFYMPAGDRAAPRQMGGARDTSIRPNRRPGVPTEEQPASRPEEQQAPLQIEGGTPIEQPTARETPPTDDPPTPERTPPEIASLDEEEPDNTNDPSIETERTEDREGWGVRDWYDQKDRNEDRERIEMMTELAERLVRIDPDDPSALSLLAFYQYLGEDHEAAKKTYDRYIELYPNSPMGYNNKALALKRQGRYAEEEALYHIALSLPGDQTTTLNNLAVNLAHQKRFDEALAIMDELAEDDPDEPYAHLHRAKIYAEMGEHELALEYLERSLDGMARLGTMHSIEFRQDIRLDPSFDKIRDTRAFRELLWQYYGDDSPLPRH